jgi:hypothetical protein
MYNLGLTDKDIESKSTVDIAIAILIALRKLAKQAH